MSTSGRSGLPGPEEEAELLREAQRDARSEVSENFDRDAAEEDDGEETIAEKLEVDQEELAELGLTLDDPHQPESE